MKSFCFDDSWDDGEDCGGSLEALVLMIAWMMTRTVVIDEMLWAGMMVVTAVVHEKL